MGHPAKKQFLCRPLARGRHGTESGGETDLTKEMSLILPMSLEADTEGSPGGPGHAPRERGSAHSGGQGRGVPRCAQRPLCRRDLPSCLGPGRGSACSGGQGQGAPSLLGVPRCAQHPHCRRDLPSHLGPGGGSVPTVHSCKAGSVPPSSPSTLLNIRRSRSSEPGFHGTLGPFGQRVLRSCPPLM